MKTFAVTPTEAELQSLERDLHFYPTSNPSPKVLTAEQVAHFNARGFVTPLQIYSPAEISAIRKYFDELLTQVVAAGGNSYSISSAHMKYGPVHDIMTNPNIVDLVSDLLGENVIGWGAHFFCKMPGDGKAVAWHQDASYWPLSPSKAVTVWLAIDDADAENACMKFIAGSHHHGHMTYRPSSSSDHNVLNQTIENAEQYGEVVWNPLPAGWASIHSDLLLHGSDVNSSNRRRCALTLRYCSADVHAALGWNEKGVQVRGADKQGHWANVARPD
ncbi:MAG: phytanoyl-CoA dioxygenase family protein [Pirellulaceae bacterium]|nr:phytanoyl-CoA dioxygenase family protein [Pirellulaceae bacterium]